MKRFLVVLVVAILVVGAIGAAVLAGYWPEHQRRQALAGELSDLRVELAEATARVRLGELLGELLALEDAIAAQDYGQAQAQASTLFDAARAEVTRVEAGPSRAALEQVVRLRDPVTAGLARGEASTLARVEEAEALVRGALGYPRPVMPRGGEDDPASASASGG
jgi:hypothetical protein